MENGGHGLQVGNDFFKNVDEMVKMVKGSGGYGRC